MSANTSENKIEERQAHILKCYLHAAIVGAIAALSGAFAFCVYDGYTRLHEGLCNCAKYAAMVAAAFSHPIALIGAFAGVFVLSAVYLVKLIYRIYLYHRHG
jgi:hypothetical protein